MRELRRVLPEESIIYFGDTGRVPYGNRSADTIYKYAIEDIRFLLAKRVKMVVAACGTVSSVASGAGENISVPFTGVVKPASLAAAKRSASGRIGIIGTAATVNSHSYKREICAVRDDAQITEIACPLFVPLVENGFISPDDDIVRAVIPRYLEPMKAAGVDTLILGCTHYPILKEAIARYLGDGVQLVDTGEETAHYVRKLLDERDMHTYDGSDSTCHYYVTDRVAGFAATANLLLGEDISKDVEYVELESLK